MSSRLIQLCVYDSRTQAEIYNLHLFGVRGCHLGFPDSWKIKPGKTQERIEKLRMFRNTLFRIVFKCWGDSKEPSEEKQAEY